MKRKALRELTDNELIREAKRFKTASIINAVLIGFALGIVFYSFMNNRLGLITLIPLFIAYKLVNNPIYRKDELEHHLRERNLK